jgi:hypothetical protein
MELAGLTAAEFDHPSPDEPGGWAVGWLTSPLLAHLSSRCTKGTVLRSETEGGCPPCRPA